MEGNKSNNITNSEKDVEYSNYLVASIVGTIAVVSLNRPKALNALSAQMITNFRHHLSDWRTNPAISALFITSTHPQVFCAGGDIKQLYKHFNDGALSAIDDYFAFEYRFDYELATFPKPVFVFAQGLMLGGGLGLFLSARLTGGQRLMVERATMGMPETKIGLFPDVGAAWFLARTPGHIGEYMAITGNSISASDALYAGLSDHIIADDRASDLLTQFAELLSKRFSHSTSCIHSYEEALSKASVSVDPKSSHLAQHQALIDRHFAGPTIQAIVDSLKSGASDWSQSVLAEIQQRSPLSMAISLEHVRRARNQTLDACLRDDVTLGYHSIRSGDVIEGIRSKLIDRDDCPKWKYPAIADLNGVDIASFFVFPPSKDNASNHPLADLA